LSLKTKSLHFSVSKVYRFNCDPALHKLFEAWQKGEQRDRVAGIRKIAIQLNIAIATGYRSDALIKNIRSSHRRNKGLEALIYKIKLNE
jgi:hypothetical protein